MDEPIILLVEDDLNNAALTIMALKEARLDNKVVVAADGMQALELLLAPSCPLSPVLVLLDLAMPRMDGWETLRRMRRDGRTAALPVIVVTSSEQEEVIERLRALGADGYIHKSVSFARFTADIREAVLPLLKTKEGAPRLGP